MVKGQKKNKALGSRITQELCQKSRHQTMKSTCRRSSRGFRNRLECMQEAWMGGPTTDDKSIQKERGSHSMTEKNKEIFHVLNCGCLFSPLVD